MPRKIHPRSHSRDSLKGKKVHELKNKIRLDTYQDAVNFVNIVSTLGGRVVVTDNDNHCVNGKSLMGMIYALEFEELWVEAENDIYSAIERFIVNE